MRRFEDSRALQGAFDFTVSLVLAECIDSPNGGGNPADQRYLHQKADKARHRAANGDKGQPGEYQGDEQSQGASL